MSMEIAEKICTGCGETKAQSEFRKDAQKRDGLTCRCAECLNRYAKTDAVRARNLAYRSTDAARADQKVRNKRYTQTETGRAALAAGVARYAKTERGSAIKKAAVKRFKESEQGRASLKESAIRFKQSEHGRVSLKESAIRYMDANPEKIKAHYMLNNAIKAGAIVPWSVCAIWDCAVKPEAHHPDYDRPLDVVWLCRLHHKQAHASVLGDVK